MLFMLIVAENNDDAIEIDLEAVNLEQNNKEQNINLEKQKVLVTYLSVCLFLKIIVIFSIFIYSES